MQYLRWLLGDDWMRWDSDDDGEADSAVFLHRLYSRPTWTTTANRLIDEASGEAVMRALPPGSQRGILRGDFGNSFYYKRPALDVLSERLPATIELGVTALLVG